LQVMEVKMSSIPWLMLYLGSWRPITFGGYNSTLASLASFYQIIIIILFYCFSINNTNFLKFQHFKDLEYTKLPCTILGNNKISKNL
jgi:hypothetical protein